MKSFYGAFAAIDFALAKLGSKGNVSTKSVKREVAVAAIVSVKISGFLIAVKRIIGGVEIDENLFGFFRNGLHPLRDDEVFDGSRIGDDFFVAGIGGLRGKFDSVEGGLSGEGLAFVLGVAAVFPFEIFLVHRKSEGWITTKVIVIIEVFVTKDEAVYPLGEKVGDGVLDEFLIAVIIEAVCELFDQAPALFDFAQNESPTTIAGEMSTLEVGDDVS